MVDEKTEPYIVKHSIVSQDAQYNAVHLTFGGNVTIEVYDDDYAGVTIEKTSTNGRSDTIGVREGGAYGSYLLVLDSEPTKEFVVHIALEEGEPDDISTDLTEIVFDNGNWNVACEVLVLSSWFFVLV